MLAPKSLLVVALLGFAATSVHAIKCQGLPSTQSEDEAFEAALTTCAGKRGGELEGCILDTVKTEEIACPTGLDTCLGARFTFYETGKTEVNAAVDFPIGCFEKNLCAFTAGVSADDIGGSIKAGPVSDRSAIEETLEYTTSILCCTNDNCVRASDAFGVATSALVAAAAILSVALF